MNIPDGITFGWVIKSGDDLISHLLVRVGKTTMTACGLQDHTIGRGVTKAQLNMPEKNCCSICLMSIHGRPYLENRDGKD